jgi:Tfp pilus assembly protein FimT
MKQLIAILGLLALPAMAQEAVKPDVDWEQLRAQATELRGRAKQMRTQADKTQTDADRLCREKLLVSSCLDDAKKARQEAERAIRRVELEAVEIDRRLRYHNHEVKLEQRRQKARRE